jgi:ankyrin repeat protein
MAHALDAQQYAPLHDACEAGQTEAVRELISHGASLVARTEFGLCALHEAAAGGHTGTIAVLLDARASLEAKSTFPSAGFTPFMQACYEDHVDAAVLLLERGADMEARSSSGGTALHWACGKGHVCVAAELLRRGASSTARDEDGRTPLHWACRSNFGEAVCLLLAHSPALVSMTDHDGRTPIHYAAAFDGDAATIGHLLRAGASPIARDNGGCAPLHLHCRKEQVDGAVVRVLLAHGASLADADDQGTMPMCSLRPNELDGILAESALAWPVRPRYLTFKTYDVEFDDDGRQVCWIIDLAAHAGPKRAAGQQGGAAEKRRRV